MLVYPLSILVCVNIYIYIFTVIWVFKCPWVFKWLPHHDFQVHVCAARRSGMEEDPSIAKPLSTHGAAP